METLLMVMETDTLSVQKRGNGGKKCRRAEKDISRKTGKTAFSDVNVLEFFFGNVII